VSSALTEPFPAGADLRPVSGLGEAPPAEAVEPLNLSPPTTSCSRSVDRGFVTSVAPSANPRQETSIARFELLSAGRLGRAHGSSFCSDCGLRSTWSACVLEQRARTRSGRLTMRNTVLALAAAATLLAVTAALIPNTTPMAMAAPKCVTSGSYSGWWGSMGYPTKACPDGIVACGLMVW